MEGFSSLSMSSLSPKSETSPKLLAFVLTVQFRKPRPIIVGILFAAAIFVVLGILTVFVAGARIGV